MNNEQKEKLANQRKILNERKKKRDLKNLRLLNNVFCAISVIATFILFMILFSGGSIASISTGPFAILLIPAIIIAALVVLAIVVAYVCFINSIINTYATTVENIQTITDIVTEAHNSKNADANENVTADKTTSAE